MPDNMQDKVDQARQQASLEGAVKALTSTVERLIVTVDKNNERLEDLAVVQVQQRATDAAVERAFGSIKGLREDFDRHKESVRIAHKGYDRYISIGMGFIAAVSIAWTVFGYRINNTFDRLLRTSAQMDVIISATKLTIPNIPDRKQ